MSTDDVANTTIVTSANLVGLYVANTDEWCDEPKESPSAVNQKSTLLDQSN